MSGNLLLQVDFSALPKDVFGPAVPDLQRIFFDAAVKAGIKTASENIKVWYSVYRIGVLYEDIPDFEGENLREIRGPKASAAYDFNNQPTPALVGFAAAHDMELKDLVEKEVNGVKYLFALKPESVLPPEKRFYALSKVFEEEIPFAVSPWSSCSKMPQPVLNFTAMLDDTVLNLECDGLQAGNEVLDRRNFEFKSIKLESASDYSGLMREFGLFPEFSLQKSYIDSGIKAVLPDESFVSADSVNYLQTLNFAEGMTPFLLNFDPKYLALDEVITRDVIDILTDYIICENRDGQLQPWVVGFSESSASLAQPKLKSDSEDFSSEEIKEKKEEIADSDQSSSDVLSVLSTELSCRNAMLDEYLSRLSCIWQKDFRLMADKCRSYLSGSSPEPIIPENTVADELEELVADTEAELFDRSRALSVLSNLIGEPGDLDIVNLLSFLAETASETQLSKMAPNSQLTVVIGFLKDAPTEENMFPADIDPSYIRKVAVEVKDYFWGRGSSIERRAGVIFFIVMGLYMMQSESSNSHTIAAKICSLLKDRGIKLDLFDFLREIKADGIVDKQIWLDEIKELISEEDRKEFLNDTFFEAVHIDPFSLFEAVSDWNYHNESASDEISLLYKEIENVIGKIASINPEGDKNEIESELSLCLDKLESGPGIDYIAIKSFFTTEKINIEACLDKIKTVPDNILPETMWSALILQRTYDIFKKLPFIKRNVGK